MLIDNLSVQVASKQVFSMGQNRLRTKLIAIALATTTTLILIACSNISQSDTSIAQKSVTKTSELTIWWEQGYNLAEDEMIRQIVKDWRLQSNSQVKLMLFTNDELTAKTERADKADRLPDLMMSNKGDYMLYSRLAWQNKLEDVSDLIEPVENSYSSKILRAITYSNQSLGRHSYYGVPLYQSVILIFYWQKLLASADLSFDGIPQDWNGFWEFWQQAQTKIRAKLDSDIYSLGLSLAGDRRADDTHYLFEQILEAYNVSLLSDRQELQVDLPKVRQGIIDCLGWYAKLYQEGYIPPDAVEWSNSDNNLSLLNGEVIMTPNATLSIPATIQNDPDTYNNELGIVQFPRKPDGQQMRYLLSIKQAVIFKDSLHKSAAKDFLRYVIQPQVMTKYLKATNSRNQPVQDSVWSNSYWQNTKDPYVATATQILTSEQTRLSYVVEHPAYSQVLAENVWGQALTKVTAKEVKPEQAASEAISRIKEIFTEWQ